MSANHKSGLSPQFILKASLCREPHCASEPEWKTRAISEIENLGWYPGYAEPGYTDPPKGVLLANWNYFPSRIDDTLTRAGFDIEWSDEWSTCDNCGKLIRTSPNGYDWQPYSVMMNDCDLVCLRCVDWAEYLESIEDNPSSAVMRKCDPSKYGYQLVSEPRQYQNGLHTGMDDNPRQILKALHAAGKTGIIFRIPETSQFYIEFETWERIPEA